MSITPQDELNNQITDIDAKIDEIQKLISFNEEKEKSIESQLAQENDDEKRKSLNIELLEVTRDSLSLHQKQVELNSQQFNLLRKKFENLKYKRQTMKRGE